MTFIGSKEVEETLRVFSSREWLAGGFAHCSLQMTMLSRTTVGIAAVCGTLFMGYCIYFDKKRRSAPDFKKKLREKRK